MFSKYAINTDIRPFLRLIWLPGCGWNFSCSSGGHKNLFHNSFYKFKFKELIVEIKYQRLVAAFLQIAYITFDFV